MKKLISLLLALALALSLGGAAFAADTPADKVRIIQWSPTAEAEESGEDAGEAEGETEEITEPEVVEETTSYFTYTGLDPQESVGDIIISNGLSWEASGSCVADRVEIEPGAVVSSDNPVVILFSESDTVQDGEVQGNIRFIRDYDEIIAIVHTNDTQGYLEVEPYVKGLADQLKDSGAYSLVLTVNAGDVFNGGYAAAHVYDGEYVPYVMGDVYDFFTWGSSDVTLPGGEYQAYFLSILSESAGAIPLVANRTDWKHVDTELYAREYEPAVGTEEFVALYDDVLSLTEEGNIDYSALDLESYALERGDNVLTDGAVIETDMGTKLGLFGLTSWSEDRDEHIFVSDDTTIEAAQTMADALREEGADVVVGLGHTGWWGGDSEETGDNDANSAQVAKYTTGINAYVDGGTSSVIGDGLGWVYENGSSATIVTQASGNGDAIGVMYLILKDGQVRAVCGENLFAREDGTFSGVSADPNTTAKVIRCYTRLAQDGYNTAYASTDQFLNGERLSAGNAGGGIRANETNLGDLVADGLLWIAKQRWQGESISAALVPADRIGSSLRTGSITLADALSVFSKPSQLVYKEYTNKELVALFTDLCASLGTESDTMYQVAGIAVTYDEETMELATLAVDDILYYDRGTYMMDENQVVRAAVLISADEDAAEDTVIVESSSELAQLWCDYLLNGGYTIYPNELHPAWRIAPAAPAETEEDAGGE